MIKVYKIKVEDKVYEVELEEVTSKNGNIENTAKKEVINSNSTESSNKVLSPMQGVILNVNVKVGDQVKKGDTLVLLEAMKMENPILSPNDGVIVAVKISKGDTVNTNDILIEIK